MSASDIAGIPGSPDVPDSHGSGAAAPGGPGALVPRTVPPAPRRSRGVLGTELRRGVGPWCAGAVVAVCWVTMYGKSPQWMGRWAETTDLLRVAALLLCGPLAVAVGCWQGGRERRRATGDLLASLPRAPLRRTLLAVAPAAVWPAAGYLLAAAGCALATWPYAAGGGPFLSLVAADAVALAALGVLGFVAGRLIPWRLAAPLLAAVTYVGLGVPAYADSPARWLDPALDHMYFWDRPVWWFGPASMVWTAGLAGAALLAYAARRRISALPPLAAACAAAVLLAGTGDGLWRPDPAAARLVCDDGAPQVCVTAVDRKLLPSVSAALAGLNARLRGVPGAPVRWIDGPRAPGPGREQLAAAPGVVVRKVGEPVLLGSREAQLPDPFSLSEHGEISDPALYAKWAVGYLFSQDCSGTDFDTPAARRATAVNDAVNQWLAPRPDSAAIPLYGGDVHLRRLRAMDRAESRAYLARYLAADLCRAEEVPVP
ncbi:hypothetical protein AB0P17_36790 [Streptomyces sp. NPDC088124]|uniref:hypothetical protein n=1 Tax=Streptomyces sp. NPDC088124 TaxID=3154654 RepID=UPI003432F448